MWNWISKIFSFQNQQIKRKIWIFHLRAKRNKSKLKSILKMKKMKNFRYLKKLINGISKFARKY